MNAIFQSVALIQEKIHVILKIICLFQDAC